MAAAVAIPMPETRHDVARQPALVVTVDVEGDNLWSRPTRVTTSNARFLPRFHELCVRHGLPPVYLTTHEMAQCADFRTFAGRVLARGEGEIGMHLHAWNSPPDMPLTPDDAGRQPYLTEYGEPVMRQKIAALTRVLEDVCGTAILSHRGGRWAFDDTYARLLIEHGYLVDSTVTPHVVWHGRSDSESGFRAPDYTGFPEAPYFVDPDDVRRPGQSPLLEVPVTTCRIPLERLDGSAGGPAAPFIVRWLRPNGRNLKALRWVLDHALDEARPCLVLMLHSSELMPGGSPTCPQAEDVEALYRDLDAFFAVAARACRGRTLTEVSREARESGGI
jgi:peptidoglycan/xylan/chitin deacetylase (PgdA/CDA1 family)